MLTPTNDNPGGDLDHYRRLSGKQQQDSCHLRRQGPGGETIIWDLEGDDDDKLDISSAGVVTFNTIPDFESPADHNTDGEYEITVIASDGTNKETQDVRITITNVNEAPVLTVVEEVTFRRRWHRHGRNL